MSKEITVITLGIWIAVVPYLGVPSSWKTTIIILSGFAVIILGFLLRTEALARGGRHSPHQTFIENLPDRQAGTASSVQDQQGHERKERINSLN